MKTFEEVLRKHKNNIGLFGWQYTWNNYYFYKYSKNNSIVEVCLHLRNIDEIEIKSFTSPEKLDQFLTLLFGEEP